MRSLPILASLMILAACSGPASQAVSYTPPATPGGRLCTSQCSEARGYCREDCDLQQRQCASKVQGQALIDYEKYMSQQFLHADPIDLRARDFERMQPCDDEYKNCTAACETKHESCYTTCGGTVSVTSSCKFLCF